MENLKDQNQNDNQNDNQGDKNSTTPPPPVPQSAFNIPEGTEFVPGNGKDIQDGFKWKLPSGKECTYRKLIGYNVRMAQRIAGSDESLMTFALLSQALSIDGVGVTVEELDLMLDDDIFEIMEKRQLFTLARKK